MSLIRVGFHVEGWDYLILKAYLSVLMAVPDDDIEPDVIGRDNRGWSAVPATATKALHRFYAKCAHLAVLGVDNDGNVDLTASSAAEDPKHPRHANHLGSYRENCRHCHLAAIADATRPQLTWLPNKPGAVWPIVIAVPVETIEAWLLTTRAIVEGNDADSFAAERSRRSELKQRFYGRPIATETDVRHVALPLVRSLSADQCGKLARYSKSFTLFKEDVAVVRDAVLSAADCWAPENG